jgi:hypothetical protein
MLKQNSGSFFLASLVTVFLAFAVSGCGIGNEAPSASSSSPALLRGILHGGPNPISGATVTLYATANGTFVSTAPGSYTTTATQLSQTSTLSDGSFTFTGAATCPSGQQAYVTASGGDAGSGSNPYILLMAALGDCSTISTSTKIFISEVTTVVAGYALRPFMSITSDSTPIVNIGAPAGNNNGSTGACSVTTKKTTGCASAGLSHAFQNALNLASSVSNTGTSPTGTAYSVAPSNPNSSVPQALIDSLANSVEACVNSTPQSSSASTTCLSLFTAATPPGTGTTSPANTLQAIMNIAQYPSNNVSSIWGIVVPTSYYQPTLTSQPTDYSLAITYNGVVTTGKVGAITLTNYGSGYTAPTVSITGGGGSGATAVASIGLSGVTVTNGGSGYTTSKPLVGFSGGGGQNAAATATVTGGVVTGITLTNPGFGYTSAPTVTFVGGSGSGVTATATIGSVGGIAITAPGSGYTSTPTVTITDSGSGSGAAATATTGVTPFAAPYSLALDANDEVFVSSQNTIAATSGLTSFTNAMGSNGTTLFSSTPNTTYVTPRGSTTDTLGDLWIANDGIVVGTSPTAGGVECLSLASGGSCTSPAASFITSMYVAYPVGVGVDLSNDLWAGFNSSTVTNLYEYTPTAYAKVAFANKLIAASDGFTVLFDTNQNVWVAGSHAVSATVYINTGTATAPAYGTTATPGDYVAVTLSSSGTYAGGIALDSSNNAWAPTSTGLSEVVPTYTGAGVSALAEQTQVADDTNNPVFDEVDGNGNVWIPSSQTTGTPQQTIVEYVPAGASAGAYYFTPCYAASGATTCSNSLSAPQRALVDSTGSVWVISQNNGLVYQLIGTGAPTWPQLSLSAAGVMPH